MLTYFIDINLGFKIIFQSPKLSTSLIFEELPFSETTIHEISASLCSPILSKCMFSAKIFEIRKTNSNPGNYPWRTREASPGWSPVFCPPSLLALHILPGEAHLLLRYPPPPTHFWFPSFYPVYTAALSCTPHIQLPTGHLYLNGWQAAHIQYVQNSVHDPKLLLCGF